MRKLLILFVILFSVLPTFSQYWEKVFDNRDSLWFPPFNEIGQAAQLECYQDTCIMITNLATSTPSVFRSENKGVDWSVKMIDSMHFRGIRTESNRSNILSLELDWPNIVAASDSNSYYYSWDGGETWDRNKIEEPKEYNRNSSKVYKTRVFGDTVVHMGYSNSYISFDKGGSFDTIRWVQRIETDLKYYSRRDRDVYKIDDNLFFCSSESGWREDGSIPQSIDVYQTENRIEWDTVFTTYYGEGDRSFEGFSSNGKKLYAYGYRRDDIEGSRVLRDYILQVDMESSETKVVLDTFARPTVSAGNIVSSTTGIRDITWRDSLHGIAVNRVRLFWETDDGGDTWFFSKLNDVEHGALISLPGQWPEENATDLVWFADGSMTFCNYGGQVFRYYPWPVSVENEINPSIYAADRPWVYPQPATTELNYNLVASGKVEVTVTDMTGRHLITTSEEVRSLSTGRLDISSLTSGNYILSVAYQDGRVISNTFRKE